MIDTLLRLFSWLITGFAWLALAIMAAVVMLPVDATLQWLGQ